MTFLELFLGYIFPVVFLFFLVCFVFLPQGLLDGLSTQHVETDCPTPLWNQQSTGGGVCRLLRAPRVHFFPTPHQSSHPGSWNLPWCKYLYNRNWQTLPISFATPAALSAYSWLYLTQLWDLCLQINLGRVHKFSQLASILPQELGMEIRKLNQLWGNFSNCLKFQEPIKQLTKFYFSVYKNEANNIGYLLR